MAKISGSIRSFQQRPTMLIIPGMWECAKLFEKWVKYFEAAGFKCIAIDLRGHGSNRDKVPDIGKVSIRDYIQDVMDEINRIDGPVVLVGHSMGGLIAQAVAATGNPKIKGLIPVCSAPPRGIRIHGQVLLRMLRPQYLKAIFGSKPLMITRTDAIALELNQPEQHRFYELLIPESGKAAREIIFWQIAIDAKNVKCKSMVLAGTDDKIIPAGITKNIAKKYCSEYVELPGTHMLMLGESAEEAVNMMTKFINTVTF